MTLSETIHWEICRFEQLTARQAYQLAQLRVDVFVVEQACPYRELDGLDLLDNTWHIIASVQECPVAYARILAPHNTDPASPSTQKPPVHIGRVVVKSSYRRHGLATALMQRAIECCDRHYAEHDQMLAAQVCVQGFYAKLGFSACSEHYLEDGIPHVDMMRRRTSS